MSDKCVVTVDLKEESVSLVIDCQNFHSGEGVGGWGGTDPSRAALVGELLVSMAKATLSSSLSLTDLQEAVVDARVAFSELEQEIGNAGGC